MRLILVVLVSLCLAVLGPASGQDEDLAEMVRLFEDEMLEMVEREEQEQTTSTASIATTPQTVRPTVCARPKNFLRWYRRITIPWIGGRCAGRGKFAVKEHCSKYLTCSSRYFGLMRTCSRGKMFDSVHRTCMPADLVNCCKM